MKPKQFNKKKSTNQYETEVVWKSPDGDLISHAKKFLNGKAILFIRKKRLLAEPGTQDMFYRLQFTVMRFNQTSKPKHLAKKGI